MRNCRRLNRKEMCRIFIILLILVYGCSPKLATKGDTEDYSEDVSEFRPMNTNDVNTSDVVMNEDSKGPYVTPTHDINKEMSSIMDSIVAQNLNKMYLTYTIQVYIGRSREEANQIREKIYRVLPEEKPILTYRQPSYKVFIGKYHEKVDAYKTLNILRASFPGAMLVPQHKRME